VKSGYPMLIYNVRSKQSSSLDKVLPSVNLYIPVPSNIMYKTKCVVAKLNIAQKYKVIAAFKIHANLRKLLIRSHFKFHPPVL
jgi:hypothetical protein